MTENAGRKINNRITVFSFILSVLVVYLHAKNVNSYGLIKGTSFAHDFVINFEWFISDNVAKGAVPGFFMLSGLLFYKSFDMSLYKNKMLSRFNSLVIPYLCWNVLRLFYALFIRNVMLVCDEKLVVDLNMLLNSIFLYKFNQGYWYMFQLILYVFLCPFVYALIKNKWAGIVSLALLFTVNMWPGLPEKVPVLLTDSFFFYMLGSYLGRFFFDIISKEPKWPVVSGGVLFVLSQFSMYFYMKTDFILYYFLFCLTIVCSLFILTAMIKNVKLPVWMSFSFFIYSLHGTILESAEQLLSGIFPRLARFALLEYIILPVFAIFVIVLIGTFLKNKLPFVWKLLNGGRQQKKENKKRGFKDADLQANV